MPEFHVTYEIVTPESAEHGDAEERGFVDTGGWRYQEPCALSLREAVDLVGCVENSGSCFTETDERYNYQDGSAEQRSLHPPRNITRASYRRLARLLQNGRL